MFSNANKSQPELPSSPNDSTLQIPRKSRKRLYALGVIVAVIVASALFIPQVQLALPKVERDLSGSDTIMQLSLNYQVGEHLIYKTANIITNNLVNGSLPISTNN